MSRFTHKSAPQLPKIEGGFSQFGQCPYSLFFLTNGFPLNSFRKLECLIQDKYSCPHCREGREQGVLETPEHLLSECSAYAHLRAGLNPEAVLEDRASFLRKAINRRKELEAKLKTRS